MIAFLRGRVLDKQPNRIIVDVQGVGYEVHVPLSTYYDVGDEGAEVAVRVYTHVREDALQLYGFLTDLERQLFERLIGISGIGPKLAIAVLSGIDSRDLRRAGAARRRRPADRAFPASARRRRSASCSSCAIGCVADPSRRSPAWRRRRARPIACAATCSRRCRTSAIIGRRPRRPSSPRCRRCLMPRSNTR